ncbi:MAG: ARMT1-like domain-containing protein [Planctomycetes bacterium]|nr:ARMT1-like domain-containing protein [Planctomycetota bacterium]
MKPLPDCVPDALAMIIATAKAVSDDDFIHRKVLLKVMGEIAEDGDLGVNPADIYLQCWEIACRALGVKDPYENEKARGDKAALGILKAMADRFPSDVGSALRAAIRMSFTGAMLNFSGLGRFEIEQQIQDYLEAAPDRDDTDELLLAINKANSVVIVANRAGEIVLDKPLAETMAAMGKKVTVVVAARPIFLMATEKNAENAGFDPEVDIVSPGTAMYGLDQERTSSEFRSLLSDAGLVIVKGAVHFNTMTRQRDMFFILKAAQEEDAASLDIPTGGGAIVRVPAVGR